MKRVCVFCGSNLGTDPAFVEGAAELGRLLAQQGIGLVYGGGNVGLMGVLADSVLASGGEVIGVIPEALVNKELAHRGITDLRIVSSMHERKALMAELAEGFMALPGGYGTWEEFWEIVTWCQLGLHRKPCGLLNIAGFYDPTLEQVRHGVSCGFIRKENRDIIVVENNPSALLERLRETRLPVLPKWIDREET